ncbi:MAG TPA: hypothetical protein VMG10_17655 [Gemmataceae bacterium]|nr:hypothetical protein [Gemmataceae bacterium]
MRATERASSDPIGHKHNDHGHDQAQPESEAAHHRAAEAQHSIQEPERQQQEVPERP